MSKNRWIWGASLVGATVVLAAVGLVSVAKQRGLQVARHDHSSPSGIWARGLVVSNRWGEPRLELVYRSVEWKYGFATFSQSGACNHWFGLRSYPKDEPPLIPP